jgi:predicted transcriptional regulator
MNNLVYILLRIMETSKISAEQLAKELHTSKRSVQRSVIRLRKKDHHIITVQSGNEFWYEYSSQGFQGPEKIVL